ncbi:DNA repair exonuclease subunit 2 protein [Rhizobium phage RHph_I1_18]|nr:DNA repair exonuclease subunit 2 protein [Rhizobium phage RHph_I1_18]
MAKLLSLRFKNLLRVGNSFVTFDLQNQGITLIVGKNGTGKSTFVDALSFVLFKQPLRKVKLGQLVNAINKKDLVVELALESKGERYIIRRGLKPNLFEIYRNGELINPTSSLDEYQEMLEKDILNLSYKTFKQVDVLSKTSFVPFMELGAPERRKVVEDLLDAHIYGIMNEVAKADAKQLKLDIESTDKEINSLKALITAQRELIARHNDNKEEKVALLNESIANAHRAVESIENQIEEAQRDVSKAILAVESIPVDSNKARDMLAKYKADFDSLGNRNTLLLRNIDKFNELTCCPTCKQDVGDEHKSTIVGGYKAEVTENASQMKVFAQRGHKLEPLIKQAREAESELTEKQSIVNRLKAQASSARNQVEQLERKLTELEETVDEVGENDQVKLDAQLEDLRKKIDDFDELNVKLEVKQRAVKATSDTGLKAKLISKYIPKINERLNFYLGKMDMFVEFTLDEQFNETIKDRFRDTFTYNSFSEGQKARINMALMLTWRDIAMIRNSTMSNVLVLDEVFDGSADAEANNDFAEILRTLNESGNTIYLISHNDHYKEMFSNVIEVSSNGNYSEYTRP